MSEHQKVRDFEKLLEKKRKSDALPKEDLEGKYKKAYQRLKQEICVKLSELLPHFVLSGMMFEKHDIEAGVVCQNAQNIMNHAMQNEGFAIKARNAAYEKYNITDILLTLVPVHNKIIYEAYSQYWIDRCKPVTVPGYSHYNSIVDMWYNVEKQQWMRQADGVVEYTTYYPPTRELFDEQYQECHRN